MTAVHIHAPAVTSFAAVNHCPTCERPRRMLGQHAEWYGTTWTCAGCGDRWADGEMLERPFPCVTLQHGLADAVPYPLALALAWANSIRSAASSSQREQEDGRNA